MLAHTLGPGPQPPDEHRHIGPEFEPQRREFRAREACPPKLVKRHQRRGGIRTAATETATGGDALAQRDLDSARGARGFFEQSRGAQREVGCLRHAWNVRRARDAAVVGHAKFEFVAVIEKLEHRLQQVVAVGAPADDVQEQIELRRSGPDFCHAE